MQHILCSKREMKKSILRCFTYIFLRILFSMVCHLNPEMRNHLTEIDYSNEKGNSFFWFWNIWQNEWVVQSTFHIKFKRGLYSKSAFVPVQAFCSAEVSKTEVFKEFPIFFLFISLLLFCNYRKLIHQSYWGGECSLFLLVLQDSCRPVMLTLQFTKRCLIMWLKLASDLPGSFDSFIKNRDYVIILYIVTPIQTWIISRHFFSKKIT